MQEKIEKTVYFVRHGQSEGNIESKFWPQDAPLTELGRKQAKQISERIAKLSFESLIVSTLCRTKETAELITKKTGKIPEYSELFVERIWPSRLPGKSRQDEEVVRLHKEWVDSLCSSGLRVEDGENFDDLIARAGQALDFLKNRPEKVIVVVTHGFFLKTIIAKVILGDTLTPETFKSFQSRAMTENAGLSVLRYGDTWNSRSWYLWVYNDQAHLG